MSEKALYIAVDVGTQSVRAAVVQHDGDIITTAAEALQTANPQENIYTQSTEQIWSATCAAVRGATVGVDVSRIAGIGFDATCSLAVLDEDFRPLCVSPSPKDVTQNVILWMDHRAEQEASFINGTNHEVLRFVGGKISPEMQPPKLLWLKRNMPELWQKAGHFMDLPDFMTWRATGSLSRSLCSLVCKWGYKADASTQGWDDGFLQAIGLHDLIDNNYMKIGNKVLIPGEPCGEGLSEKAAMEFGVRTKIPVATSIIDAHAGGIGLLGCAADLPAEADASISSRMGLICGTSTCHMAVSDNPIFTPGVWGPYYSAMVPQKWLMEAGQSAAGALVDHIINTHPAQPLIQSHTPANVHIQQTLNETLKAMSSRDGLDSTSYLTNDLHIWPDFHGNRSPIADPRLKGMVSGLTLSVGREELARLYLSTIQALAYGTRHIIECLEKSGHSFSVLLACGGLAKNELFVQMHADATGRPVILPQRTESVLLGSAILGATASGAYPTVQDAMAAMSGSGRVILPNVRDRGYHQRKYQVFLEMWKFQSSCQKIMKH